MKVLVKLHMYSGDDDVLIESKSVTVDADPNSHVRSVVYNAIHKANWHEEGLRIRSIRYRDKDFDEELDANESDRVVNLATYDVVLVREPTMGGMYADTSALHADGFHHTDGFRTPYGRSQPIFFTVSTMSRQPRMLVFGLPSRTGQYPTAEDAAIRRNRHERIEGETVGSGTYVGNVEWTFSVLRLKELIQTLQDSTTRHFGLVFHGQPMRDDKLLADFPIEDESRLEMIVASTPIYP